MLATHDTTNPQTTSRSQHFLPTLSIRQGPPRAPVGSTPVLLATVRRQTDRGSLDTKLQVRKWTLNVFRATENLQKCVCEHMFTGGVYLQIVGRVGEATEMFPLSFSFSWKGRYFIFLLAIHDSPIMWTRQQVVHRGPPTPISRCTRSKPTSPGPALPST